MEHSQSGTKRLEAISKLIEISARTLCAGDYTADQIEGALQEVFGLDSQLIDDRTYFVAESGSTIIGCGGWSKRKTLFGSDHRSERNSAELDPALDPAKIRAFFVLSDWAGKGIGKAILLQCETEAAAHGFHRLELMATLPGVRLYSRFGYSGSEQINYTLPSGAPIAFVSMRKELSGQ